MSGKDTEIPDPMMADEPWERTIERDTVLLRRGLELHAAFCEAAEAQEAARELAEKEASERGEKLAFAETEEEKAWDAYNDRALTGIAIDNRHVLEQLGLDPRKSVLFESFPELLTKACDPQVPVLYDPSIRRFALKETWGPAMRTISHCPWSGRKLPEDLADQWFDLIEELMGTDDWSTDKAREKLSGDYFNETWWIERGL
ncbi:DUF6980 family protein [Roseibium sp.]|uniref:DUF6980 family protein n=1 Tax=Roseibium sp. TaxID=1936156 RepID=UPI003B50AA13